MKALLNRTRRLFTRPVGKKGLIRGVFVELRSASKGKAALKGNPGDVKKSKGGGTRKDAFGARVSRSSGRPLRRRHHRRHGYNKKRLEERWGLERKSPISRGAWLGVASPGSLESGKGDLRKKGERRLQSAEKSNGLF